MMNVFKYVRLSDVGEHLAKGWLMADDFAGLHHGAYAVLMGRHVPDASPRLEQPMNDKTRDDRRTG